MSAAIRQGGDLQSTDEVGRKSEQLANAAMALLGCRTSGDVFNVIGEFLALLCPGSVIIINEATPEMDWLITRELVGVDKNLLSRAESLVRFRVIGKRSAINPEYWDEMISGTLSKVPGGFAEFAASEIPLGLARIVARLIGLDDVFTIGIADGRYALGNIHICTRSRETVIPVHTVESFAHHCYSALAQMRSAQKLSEVAERNRLNLQHMVEGHAAHAIILDESGRPYDYRFLDVNPAFEAMTGMRAEDVIGKTARQVSPDFDPVWLERFASVATTGVAARFEDYVNYTGRQFEVVVYSPQSAQFAASYSDVTERREAEDSIRRANAELESRIRERTEELMALNSQLTKTNSMLIEATRAKSDFLASMSHELRTPLNSIIGFTGILLQGLAGPLMPEQELQLGMVRESGRHLLTLVDDVLDLSRIESGKSQVAHQEFDVATLVYTAVETLRPLSDKKGIELILTVAEDVCELCSDSRFVSQILLNLLGNAIKFTDVGSVSLDVTSVADRVVFRVSDTGRGIRSEDLPHVQESFYQAEPIAEAKHEGAGLGLAISSQLAAMLGGRIDIESELGIGSTFTLSVPCTNVGADRVEDVPRQGGPFDPSL